MANEAGQWCQSGGVGNIVGVCMYMRWWSFWIFCDVEAIDPDISETSCLQGYVIVLFFISDLYRTASDTGLR